MKPVWLIEAAVYGAEAAPLMREIHRQGMAAELVSHRTISKGAGPLISGKALDENACVIGYGTFPFIREIQVHRRWVPGAFCSAENLDCSAYFSRFGDGLLSRRYAIVPVAEALSRADALFSDFGREGRVFVRPSSCGKTFVGRCVDSDSFADAISPAKYDASAQIVVAAPEPVGREWRLVVAGDEIIAGSQYAACGARTIACGFPAEVETFADQLLREVPWRPDPIFMIDVAESDGRLALVELSSFSGSWLYACDLKPVIAAANEIALGMSRKRND